MKAILTAVICVQLINLAGAMPQVLNTQSAAVAPIQPELLYKK